MSTCPETCPDCGDTIEEWDVNKTYSCCECVSKNSKTYRVKKNVTTTTQDPESDTMTDWIEIVKEIVSEPVTLAPGDETSETRGLSGISIFFIVMIVLFGLGLAYYLYTRTSPEIELRTERVLNLGEDLKALQAQYPYAMPYLALSKQNYDTYLKQPNMQVLLKKLKKRKK